MKKEPDAAHVSSRAENSAKTTRRGNPDKIIPHQWRKGCPSPNPSGRPKTAPLSQACREVLGQLVPDDPDGRTYAEVIAAMLAEKALEGDIRAAQEIADRAEGRSRQSVEISHTSLRDAFDRMSREELETYAREGRLPDWFPREVNNETIQ